MDDLSAYIIAHTFGVVLVALVLLHFAVLFSMHSDNRRALGIAQDQTKEALEVARHAMENLMGVVRAFNDYVKAEQKQEPKE